MESPHLGHWIKMIDHSVTVRSNRILKPYGLSRASWYILYLVNEAGKISQKKLQDDLGIESGTMAILVDGLVHKGWLNRISDEKDRRANYLRLTAKGSSQWKKVPNFIQNLRKEMMEGITREEETQAVNVLKKVWANLNQRPLEEGQ